MNSNKVSIVIPTYNSKNYLQDMVDSIKNQTYQNWELFVVDDGSTDGTDIMMGEFSNDNRIFYCHRPKDLEKGAQSCRNYGKSLATGEFICFFDADDLLSHTCLEERVKGIVDNSTDMYITPAAVFKESISDSSWSRLGRYTGEDPLKSFLSHYHQFNVWTTIFRKDAIDGISWDPMIKVFQDLDFSMACLFKGLTYSFSKSDNPTYYYRFEYSDNCISSKQATPAKVESTIYLFNKYLDFINISKNKSNYKKDFIQFHIYYYSRVVKTGDCDLINKMEDHISDKYGKYVLMVFRISKPFYKLSNNNRVVRLITMLFYYTLIRPSGILDMIGKVFKKIKSKM